MAPKMRQSARVRESSEARQSSERQASVATEQSAVSKQSIASAHSMTLRGQARGSSVAKKEGPSKYVPNVEPRVPATEPMPNKYRFVPKGDAFVTRHCRKETVKAQKTVYVVVDEKKKPMGLRVPSTIYSQVMKMDRDTRAARKQRVRKADASVEEDLEQAIMSRFPRLPPPEMNKIVCQATAKGKGRVGRTGTINIAEKARLAVQAYIRHTKTNYDDLLRDGTGRDDARRLTSEKTIDVLKEWGPASNKGGKTRTTGKPLPTELVQRTKAKRSKEKPKGGALSQKTEEVHNKDKQTRRTNSSTEATKGSPQRVKLKKSFRDSKKASLRNITATASTAEKHRKSKKQKRPQKSSKKNKGPVRQKKVTQVAAVAKKGS